jgi:hypothetical protein
MLFDVRSRGRKTTVRVVYGTIAVLFAVTFIGAGVGTGFGGNFNIGELFNSSGGNKSYAAEVSKARKATQREPNSAAAWAAMVEAQLNQSSQSEYSNQSTGGFTPKGKQLLQQVQHSWERYLALEPKNPSAPLAHKMVNVLGEGGAEQPAAEVQALQIVIAAQPPSVSLYAALAQYAYQAGNKRQGDLASEKALTLAPASQRAQIKGELAALKKNGGHPSSSSAAATAEGGEGG